MVTLKEVILFISPGQVSQRVKESLTSDDMEESVDIRNYSKIKGKKLQVFI